MVLLSTIGCKSTSPLGGVESRNEEFSISVPNHSTLKQGEVMTVLVKLDRGAYFKQDVQLDVKTDGLTVTPNNMLIKSSGKAEASLQVSAKTDAALGDYQVTVKGTPTKGKSTSTEFVITVVMP